MSTIVQSSSPEASLAGTKRKRAQEQKFYAVYIGKAPGVYHSWDDCLEQVKGFKNAIFKSFTSLTDAESFVANGLTPQSSTSSSIQKYYGVRSGRVPGVYTSWAAAQVQILGWQKPKYKSFTTRTEAEVFVNSSDTTLADAGEDYGDLVEAIPAKKATARKAKKTSTTTSDDTDLSYPPGEGPFASTSIDGMDTRLLLNATTGAIDYKTPTQASAKKMHATGPHDASTELCIYTDGASRRNGTPSAAAGVGVYFGPYDPRNLAERLQGPRQTNQRAELTAIQRALDIAPRDRNVKIYSDSDYSIKCVTEWHVGWRRNGWLTSTKKAVENRDLVEAVRARIDERDALGRYTRFQWVKGHDGDPGNVAADELAVRGAQR